MKTCEGCWCFTCTATECPAPCRVTGRGCDTPTLHECPFNLYREGSRAVHDCQPVKIKVHLRAVDGFAKTRTFKTLAGAQKFAQRYAGRGPEIGGGYYAISADGVCRITVDGAKLRDLFPDAL